MTRQAQAMSGRTPPRADNIALGAMISLVTMFTMALNDALVKYFSADFTLWQIFALRSLFSIPLVAALILIFATPCDLRPKRLAWTALRSQLLVLMWVGRYGALPLLSLSVVATGYFTAPLFVTLFSSLLIGEPVGRARWLAILVGFGGVLLILRPGGGAFSAYALLPILAAVCHALAAMITRTKCADEKPMTLSLALNISFFFWGFVVGLGVRLMGEHAGWTPLYPFMFGAWSPMGAGEWALIAMLGVFMVAISIGVAASYQVAPPSVVASCDYSYLIFAAIWGLLLLNEIPDAWTLGGMILITSAGIASARAGNARSRVGSPSSSP